MIGIRLAVLWKTWIWTCYGPPLRRVAGCIQIVRSNMTLTGKDDGHLNDSFLQNKRITHRISKMWHLKKLLWYPAIRIETLCAVRTYIFPHEPADKAKADDLGLPRPVISVQFFEMTRFECFSHWGGTWIWPLHPPLWLRPASRSCDLLLWNLKCVEMRWTLEVESKTSVNGICNEESPQPEKAVFERTVSAITTMLPGCPSWQNLKIVDGSMVKRSLT